MAEAMVKEHIIEDYGALELLVLRLYEAGFHDSKAVSYTHLDVYKRQGLVSLDDYLSTRNKLVVSYCDYFEVARAEKLSDENMSLDNPPRSRNGNRRINQSR